MGRCDVCDYSLKVCRDTGPYPSDVVLIAEKPGKHEAFSGRILIGDAGQELDQTYLPLAGLERPEVHCFNAVQCWLGENNNKPTDRQVRACALHHLPYDIERCEPSLIVLMGATACSLVPSIELEKDHGIPVWVEPGSVDYFGEWGGWVWPINHPAAALHSTSMMVPLLEDFENLGLWRAGRWSPPQSPAIDLDYREVETKSEITEDLDSDDTPYRFLPVDTENDGRTPWSLQYSVRGGHGRLIRAERRELIAHFAQKARDWDGFHLHFAGHDLDVLDAMEVQPRAFRDTMQESYHLGNLPQGLKALAWRLLGVRMRSWEDVVLPPSRAKMQHWLTTAWDVATEYRERLEFMYARPQKPGGKREPKLPIWDAQHEMIIGRWESKAGKIERDCKRIISHSHKPKYDLWEKAKAAGLIEDAGEWRERLEQEAEAEEEEQAEQDEAEDAQAREQEAEEKRRQTLTDVRAECGRVPYPSIAFVPFAEALQYAAADADIEGRVALVLERRRTELMEGAWRVPVEDHDA